jgi:hypothetical protein
MTQLTQTSSGLVTDDIPLPVRSKNAKGGFSQRRITEIT